MVRLLLIIGGSWALVSAPAALLVGRVLGRAVAVRDGVERAPGRRAA